MGRWPLSALGLALALLLGGATGARAQSPRPLRIGVLNDQSGPYADYQGVGSVIAARMAVEDGTKLRQGVEVISADHQNKTDIGAGIARQWFDRDGVDVVLDVPNSAIALAVANLAREKNRVFIGSGAGTAELTGRACSPNTVHWTYDTWALGHGLARALVAEGAKSWYFLTADYAFGKDLEGSAASEVQADGGTVKGAARHPLGTNDFSSFLLQAQGSGADVIGLANAGDDTTNAIKQAAEFGISPGQRLAGLILNVTNMPALGLKATQGVYVLSGYYWDLDAGSRAFAERYAARHPQHAMPNDMQAGVYSAVLHLLKAAATLPDAADGRTDGSPDGRALVAAMRATPTDDPIFGRGSIRADGRKIHPMHLLTTKAAADSRGPWDVFRLVRTVPADEAWRPLSEGGCPLVKD